MKMLNIKNGGDSQHYQTLGPFDEQQANDEFDLLLSSLIEGDEK